MKLYIHFGELIVSLTASVLWVSAAGVVAEKLALAIPVTWEQKVIKDTVIKYCFVMSIDFIFWPISFQVLSNKHFPKWIWMDFQPFQLEKAEITLKNGMSKKI